jgi:hypothetical protein
LSVVQMPQKKPPFTVLNADAIFAPLPPLTYVIQALDLCAGAPALWAGYGYSKKTLAAQAAALAIAAGLGKVWDCYAAPQGKVLHIDYEQGNRLTRERYQRLAVPAMVGPADLADRLALVTMPDLHLDKPQAEDAVARLVDGYGLVLIDSLRAAAPSIDENSSDARQPLDMLNRVSEKTGAAFIVIHHARKPNAQQSGGAKMAVRGSAALFDGCGSCLVFEAEKGQPTRVSHEKARASGILTDDFQIDVADVPDGQNHRAGLLVTGQGAPSRERQADDRERERIGEQQELVRGEMVELFRTSPEFRGVDELANRLRRASRTVRGVLSLMIADGQVVVEGSTKNRRHRWVG